MDISDAVLVEESINGERDSYEKIVLKYQHSVYNLAYRMTNSRADAEDISQETFIRAYKKLKYYKEEYPFKNWILTICSNLAKNVFRKRVRRRESEESYLDLQYLNEHVDNPAMVRLEDAIKRLAPNIRAALTLKHVEGCSYEEIAEILDIGVSAAKMRVKRGRDDLKKFLR